MPLYFAYGSNMNVIAMTARCPASKPLGVARLMRHRFFVSTDGYASVLRDPRRNVYGLLWDLSLGDVPALDRYESLSTGLYTKVSQPVVSDKGPRRAIVYIGRSFRAGPPRPGYMEEVYDAAHALGLPEDYLKTLRGYLPAKRTEPPEVKPVRPIWSAPSNIRR
jgi:hypothetical protein